MKDVSKVIKIDMLSVYPYITLKNLIIILIVVLFYPLVNKNIYTIYGLTQSFAIIYSSYPFVVGDKSGIDALYGAFAIDRKKVVYGRYIWSNLMILIFLILAIILTGILSILTRESININELTYIAFIVFIISNLIIAVQYPFYFKYGYGKSKIIMTSMFFLLAISGIVVVYCKDFLIKNIAFLFNNINLFIFVIILFFAILYFSSIIASIWIYQNREIN